MDVNEELNFFIFWGGGWVGRVGWDQGGCERRIELKFL